MALEPRDPTGYAQRNFAVLLALFGAFVVLGLWRDNGAALIGGALGIGWLLWANRKRVARGGSGVEVEHRGGRDRSDGDGHGDGGSDGGGGNGD